MTITTTTTIDPVRLARSLYLEVEREGPERYVVSGGAQAHVVELGEVTRCDCRDFEMRGGPCKHQLRAKLARGDAEVLGVLRLLVPVPSPARA